MSEILRLTLFGPPQIWVGDKPLTGFATNKAQALLFYLAVAPHTPHSRDALATLLWSEMSDIQAKQNLRTVLPNLRRLVGAHLRIDRQTIAFDETAPYWLDVEMFHQNLSPGQADTNWAAQQAAIALYQGEFLQGFYVRDAPLFETWVLEQREQLHTLLVEALFAVVNHHTACVDYAAALAANRRLLLIEPWSEPVHRQQMLLLAQSGERAAALTQYEACRRMLAAEFGIEPLAETTALYEQIRAGEETRASDAAEPPRASLPSGTLIQASADHTQPSQTPNQAEQGGVGFGNGNAGSPPQERGYHLPAQTKLYGRQAELAKLHKWIVEDGCHLVAIFGIGGQGKTTLAATFAQRLAEATSSPNPGGSFQHILWQSLLNAPPLAEVLQEWVYVLSDQTVTSLPASLDRQFAQLFAYLRHQRCLLVFDNLESILENGEQSGHFRPGYAAYGQLIHHLAEGEHRSCLLLTSRERPRALTLLEEDTPVVRTLTLAGLPAEAGRELLQGRGLEDKSGALSALVQHYSGNPLALKLATETVHEIFDGNITAFLQAETLVFDDIRHVLDQQFTRLTPLERELMLWLALLREPVPFAALSALLAQPPAPRQLLEAIRSLQRRSLLEKVDAGFGLQNVVLEYATDRLIENISHALVNEQMTPAPDHPTNSSLSQLVTASHLNRHPLILAQGKEYVRASQIRLLLQPVLEGLVNHLGKTGAEQQLQRLLTQLHLVPPTPGYAAANLLHLLLQLGVDLRGYNFSQLYLRQAYLRGVSLPQTNFTGAQIMDSVFTEPFGLIYTAVFSPDGHYVAAGTSEGAIYLWRTADQQLAQVLQAHQHAVKQLTFVQQTTAAGERQLVLASASDDKRIGLWSLVEAAPVHEPMHLVHEEQEALIAVGLSPDGARVTGVDIDGHVFVWDVVSHDGGGHDGGGHHEGGHHGGGQDGGDHAAQLVHHFATAFTRLRLVAFSADGQTVAIGHRDGVVRLWHVATGEERLQLAAKTGLIFALALSRDGQMLATGGRDGRLALWRLPAGELHQAAELRPHCVVETKAGAIHVLAFSPDGKFLASGHEDLAIRLWTIDAQARLQLQRTLLGHTQMIWSVAFGPSPVARPPVHAEMQGDGNHSAARQLLVTGSSDQTVRVWDAETGHTLYMLRGQPRVLAAHTIRQLPPPQPANPAIPPQAPGWLLAAAGYDQLIHLWQGQGSQAEVTHRVLHGAHGPLYAVAISPDGRCVAGAGYDRTIYLWDRVSGQLRQRCHGHTNRVYALVFHPDGKLLASGSGDGTVRLWSLPTRKQDHGRVAEGFVSDQPVAVLQADLDVVHDLAFSPDGRLLARGGSDRWLRLWDMTQSHYPELTQASRLVQDESEEDILGVAFSPDGSKVACSGNHLIHVVDLASGAAPRILRHHTSWIYAAAFSPDGKTLASSSADCTVCLWDVGHGALRAILRGHRETVYKVVFTPDGEAVVSSSFDGTIKFWDSQTGACLNTLVIAGPYAGMKITGITGVTEAQKAALQALGAVEA
ncbi:MAG: BTAD domain-containing putative transcriptional regulator [Caldilineaceae bacterium]